MLKRLLNGLLDFIIPPLCVSCGEYNEDRERYICSSCRGKLVRHDEKHPWRDEYISKGYINDSYSLYQFVKDTPIQHLLHSLKYEKMKSIGKMLGKELAGIVPPEIRFDYAVPVPLHRAKERERTYNQSEYICRGIQGVSVLPGLLRRNRFTRSQTKMDRLERIQNVKDAFGINPNQKPLVTGKNIILVDDVITTGSTIIECSRTLKDSGAGYIFVCSAAYDALD